jgi:hypothetical protein
MEAIKMENVIETRIMQMVSQEGFWFDTLRSAAGRATNGDAEGVPLRSLEDSELERVFGQCVGPVVLISAVTAWREAGRSLESFLALATLEELK